MSSNSLDSIINTIEYLRVYESESEYVEFKKDFKGPDMIGEYISSLSNSAALLQKPFAYLIWGVDDSTHEIVGCNFDITSYKVGNEDISLWLTRHLHPIPHISFDNIEIAGKKISYVVISAAIKEPVKFKGIEYIRRGEHKKKLKDCPDIEERLWATFLNIPFENRMAMENTSEDKVLSLLDYESYFSLLKMDVPTTAHGVIERFIEDNIIVANEQASYNITNFGALLFVRDLETFSHLRRKAVRVVRYNGNNRVSSASSEQTGKKGYASGFNGLISYVGRMIPTNEVMKQALRRTVPMYPELSVREVIANAIIHQDLSLSGTGVMIEIFPNRIEITNPGVPLIDTIRFLDHPPISRNEGIASFMRRIGYCEERGSGFDKVVFESELYQLPAPEVTVYDLHTRVILHAHKDFSEMNREDRIRACYLHACLRRIEHEAMTNTSLRERFKVDKRNSSMISRVLKDTMDEKLIKLENENVGDKGKRYLPFWA